MTSDPGPQSDSVYDCIVVGNEPAGLWFLDRYVRAKQATGETPKVLWLKSQESPSPLCVPQIAGQVFGLELATPQQIEIATPHQTFSWNLAELRKRFPELPLPREKGYGAGLQPTEAEASAIRFCLRKRPELLGYAQAIWKLFGRAADLNAASYVWNALLCGEMGEWDPLPSLESLPIPSSSVSDGEFTTSHYEKRHKALTLTSTRLGALTARRWILNGNFGDLWTYFHECPTLDSFLSRMRATLAPSSLWPLELRLDRGTLPAPLGQALAYLEEDDIPDASEEIWSMFIKRAQEEECLTLWIKDGADLSLETFLSRARTGMGHLYRLFPRLSRQTISLEPPLGLETCHTEETRLFWEKTLYERRRELYSFSSITWETRHPSVQALLPSLDCFLPYPLGPLKFAEELLSHVLPRRKYPSPPLRRDEAAKTCSSA